MFLPKEVHEGTPNPGCGLLRSTDAEGATRAEREATETPEKRQHLARRSRLNSDGAEPERHHNDPTVTVGCCDCLRRRER